MIHPKAVTAIGSLRNGAGQLDNARKALSELGIPLAHTRYLEKTSADLRELAKALELDAREAK